MEAKRVAAGRCAVSTGSGMGIRGAAARVMRGAERAVADA